jgi:two-component system NtrC family sensor kinase
MDHPTDFEMFYRVFQDISASLHSSTRANDVLDIVVRKSTEALNAEGALIRVLNLETHQLELGAAYGLGEQYLSKGPVSSEKIITDICRDNKVIIIKDILNDPRVSYPREAWDLGFRTILDAPLTLGDDILGILRLYFSGHRHFSKEEKKFTISIAEQGALSFGKAQLIEVQKSQYDQLAHQTEKLSALGRMAAGIAHEINNPLAGILLYGSNMLKKVKEGSPMKEGLEIIVQETIRCKGIIQELLEFSRESEPKMGLANINDIIERAVHILENEFRLHHIRVEKKLFREMVEIPLDGNQIEQVFVNLLLNAVQAIEDQGEISIQTSLGLNGKYAVVEISDNGCGIPAEQMHRIFDPFFSTKAKGTGLGLSVTYGILEKHQGHISASSQPGQGTRFVLEFPIPKEPLPNKG